MKNSTKNRLEKKAQERCKLLAKHVFSNFYSQDKTLEKAKEIIAGLDSHFIFNNQIH